MEGQRTPPSRGGGLGRGRDRGRPPGQGGRGRGPGRVTTPPTANTRQSRRQQGLSPEFVPPPDTPTSSTTGTRTLSSNQQTIPAQTTQTPNQNLDSQSQPTSQSHSTSQSGSRQRSKNRRKKNQRGGGTVTSSLPSLEHVSNTRTLTGQFGNEAPDDDVSAIRRLQEGANEQFASLDNLLDGMFEPIPQPIASFIDNHISLDNTKMELLSNLGYDSLASFVRSGALSV